MGEGYILRQKDRKRPRDALYFQFSFVISLFLLAVASRGVGFKDRADRYPVVEHTDVNLRQNNQIPTHMMMLFCSSTHTF